MVASANGWTAPEIHSHLRWLIREPDTRSQNSHATRRCRGCPLKMLSHTICCLHNPESKKNSWAGASDCGNWYFVDTVWSQPLYSVPKKKAIVYKMAQRAHKRKPDEYWQHIFGNMKPKWIVQDFWHGSGQDYHSDCIMPMVKQGSLGMLLRDAWIQRLYVQLHL